MPTYSGNWGDFGGVNRLSADAKNRAVRTFVQGLGIDLTVALAALILASVDTITTRQGVMLFAITALKTVLTTGASYVMRRFLDPSGVPTPLPPSDPGEPDAEAGATDALTVLVVVALVLLCLVLLGVIPR